MMTAETYVSNDLPYDDEMAEILEHWTQAVHPTYGQGPGKFGFQQVSRSLIGLAGSRA